MRRPTLDQSNRAFTGAVIGGGAIAGSAVSVLVSGALLAGLLRLWQGLIALPEDRRVRLIGAALAAHFAAETLSTLVNYSQPTNLLQGIVSNLPFLAFLIVFGRLSLTPRLDVLRWTEYGAIGGGIGAGLFALVEVSLLGMPRAEGLAGNAGPFALVSSLLFGFCVAAAMRNAGRGRVFAVLGACMAAVALLLSGMRSLWPMLVISPLLIAWLMGFVPKRLLSLRLLLTVAAAGMVLAAIGYTTIEKRVSSLAKDVELVTAGNYDNSLGLRLRVWDATITLIKRKPIFGHGPGLAQEALMKETQAEGRRDINFSHAHNMFLNAMMRSGLFGLAGMLAMIIVPIWLAGLAPKDATGRAGYALMACLSATYLVNGLVNISFGHDILDALFIYGMITSAYLVFGPSSSPRFILMADGSRTERPLRHAGPA